MEGRGGRGIDAGQVRGTGGMMGGRGMRCLPPLYLSPAILGGDAMLRRTHAHLHYSDTLCALNPWQVYGSVQALRRPGLDSPGLG